MSVYKSPKSPHWQYDFQHKGCRYHGSTGCTSKRDAQRVEAEVRRKATLGEKVKPSITIDEACGAWWSAKGQYLRSKKTVEYQLLNLANGMGKTVPLADVTLATIDAYIARRRATVSNASVNRETEQFRAVVNWCAARGYDAPVIAWGEAKLKEAAIQTRTLTNDEEARLFDKLPASLKPIVQFALLSGQRKTEIVMMRWADVDLGNARATVWAKGQKPHSFPLTPRMVALIANQPKVCPQVFTYVAERDSPPRKDRVRRKKGERYPFSPQGWDRKWRRALADAGIYGYRFHDNRHTAATRTESIEIAYTLLGHSDIRTTKRYFHTGEDTVRKALIASESRNSPGQIPRHLLPPHPRRQKAPAHRRHDACGDRSHRRRKWLAGVGWGVRGVSDPFLIHGPALISFSGGATSGYMLWRHIQSHGGTLPDGVHVCFANTGKERPETLQFVADCANHWGVRVRWLEWRTRRSKDDDGNVVPFDQRYEEVGPNSASRNGEPFANLIAVKGYTPNAVTRFCTSELKVRVMGWFMRAQGYEHWTNIVGLRHDEQHRVAKSRKPNNECWTVALPLDDAKVSKRDVQRFWNAQPFRLQLLPFEGNCDGCFLKARPKLWEIERTAPGTLQWWSDMENGPGKGRFVTEYSYAELIRDVRRQPDLFAGGLFDDDPEMDAECGTWCAGEAA